MVHSECPRCEESPQITQPMNISTRKMGAGGKRSPGTLQEAEERNRKPGADTGEGPENTRVKPTRGQQEDERNHIWLNHQIIHNFHQATQHCKTARSTLLKPG